MADEEQRVIDDLFRDGSDHMIIGRYDDAEQLFRLILEKRPLQENRNPADDAVNAWAAEALYDIQLLRDYGGLAVKAGLYSE